MENKSTKKEAPKGDTSAPSSKKSKSGDKAADHEIDEIIEKGLFASPPHHYIKNNPK